MDPNAALLELISLMLEPKYQLEDWYEASEQAGHLAFWLRRGGFMPDPALVQAFEDETGIAFNQSNLNWLSAYHHSV